MLQMVRLGEQYINLQHVLGVTFGRHQWQDDEGYHAVPLAIVELAASQGSGESGWDTAVCYRFYGETVAVLRRWLDERTTVIAQEAEECPEPVWALESSQALTENDEGVWDEEEEGDLEAKAEAADIRVETPAWVWAGPDIPF